MNCPKCGTENYFCVIKHNCKNPQCEYFVHTNIVKNITHSHENITHSHENIFSSFVEAIAFVSSFDSVERIVVSQKDVVHIGEKTWLKNSNLDLFINNEGRYY